MAVDVAFLSMLHVKDPTCGGRNPEFTNITLRRLLIDPEDIFTGSLSTGHFFDQRTNEALFYSGVLLEKGLWVG